ncbi:MAG: ABC transporter permease, partial [Candidatus Heimdallarchaeota archaeon]|nr:ABC transporter permease [Candidatus Heimdallarchaeota archaeon]
MGNEFLAIYWRDMVKFFRSRAMLFASLIQPALWLILYGLSMSSNFDMIVQNIPNLPGIISINYMTFIAAGIISMTILFTCLYGGISIQLDKQFGLMKEMIASPMPRSSILSGITLSGITKSLIQTVIIIVLGVILGVQFFNGFTVVQTIISILGIIGFTVLFAMGLMFLSSLISIKIDSHEGVQAMITMLTLPLFFASNALYPISSMPLVIQAISYINPLSYFITGIRYFSLGSDFFALGTQ